MNQKRKELVLEPCRVQGCIPRIHRVVVYKEGCSYRVEPGRLVVHPGAMVNFISLLGPEDSVDLWFPRGMKPTEPIHLSGQQSALVEVSSEYGVFAYAVHVPGADGGGFAEGGSPPRMIVADP